MELNLTDVLFSTLDGKEIGRLGHIEECELTAEPEPDDDVKLRYFSDKGLTMTIPIEAESVKNIEKYIICGGDRGRYNGYRLKRDGYLSPENAWMEEL